MKQYKCLALKRIKQAVIQQKTAYKQKRLMQCISRL